MIIDDLTKQLYFNSVDVTLMTLYLTRGSTRVHELPLDISFPVARAEIVDPYVMLLTENGQVRVTD